MPLTARSLSNYQVEMVAGDHTFFSDEPLGIGDGTAPGPFDLLLGSLASCTIITLKMYARRKNWPLEGVEMTLGMYSEDCPAEDECKGQRTIIECRLAFTGPLSQEQMRRLDEIANRCPVHRVFRGEIKIRTVVSNLEPI